MKTTILLLTLLTTLATAAPFELTIVPERTSGDTPGITWADDTKSTFNVHLRNTSDEPQKIFRTSNSWGFQAIAFKIKLPDGTTTTASVKPQVFTRNFPATITIPPSSHHFFPITLNTEWIGKPDLKRPTKNPATITATDTLKESPESKQHQVWTGTIKSKPLKIQLNNG